MLGVHLCAHNKHLLIVLGFIESVGLCLCADLVNVFEVFLPQLLLYPNPSDPLNGEAAAMMMRDKAKYEEHVRGMLVEFIRKEHVKRYVAFL